MTALDAVWVIRSATCERRVGHMTQPAAAQIPLPCALS